MLIIYTAIERYNSHLSIMYIFSDVVTVLFLCFELHFKFMPLQQPSLHADQQFHLISIYKFCLSCMWFLGKYELHLLHVNKSHMCYWTQCWLGHWLTTMCPGKNVQAGHNTGPQEEARICRWGLSGVFVFLLPCVLFRWEWALCFLTLTQQGTDWGREQKLETKLVRKTTICLYRQYKNKVVLKGVLKYILQPGCKKMSYSLVVRIVDQELSP